MLPAAETYLYKHSRNAVIYYFKYSELSGIFVLAVKKDPEGSRMPSGQSLSD